MANLIEHKRAHYDYETLESFEAGIELSGTEVKSLRSHKGTLEGAHISVRGGEAFLLNAEIPPYQAVNSPDFEPRRNRRLLLNKKEIAQLLNAEEARGLTIIPLAVYPKARKLKVKIAIVRGKKKIDKRDTIIKREHERDIGRALKWNR